MSDGDRKRLPDYRTLERSESAESNTRPCVCRKLRTKTAFGTLEGLTADWREGTSSTAVFWCLRTMEPWGTDQRPAHARACREGRACFEAPDPIPFDSV